MYMRLKRDINNQLYIIQSLQSFVTLHSYYKITKNYTHDTLQQIHKYMPLITSKIPSKLHIFNTCFFFRSLL